MRLFKMLTVCLLLSLGTAACSTGVPVYQELLDASFKGQHVGKMIEEFGPPDETAADSYTWKKKRDWVKPGYWYDCSTTKTIYNKKGKVVGYIKDPESCWQGPQDRTYWCNTTAFFDVAKIVTGFVFDGSDLDSILPTYRDGNGCYIDDYVNWYSFIAVQRFREY